MPSTVRDKVHSYFSGYPLRHYPKGQILVFADESPECIFYIVKGRVRKYDVSYRGDEVIINVFQPPAFFPASWAINKTPNHFFYKTETEVDLHVVPTEDARTFLLENPDVAFDLLSRMYQGLEGVYGRMVHLMSGTAKSRLLYELVIECRRFGVTQADGKCLLKTNEIDLASRSGLSRETINREMRKIKASGLVAVTKQGIIVNDLNQLVKILGKEF